MLKYSEFEATHLFKRGDRATLQSFGEKRPLTSPFIPCVPRRGAQNTTWKDHNFLMGEGESPRIFIGVEEGEPSSL